MRLLVLVSLAVALAGCAGAAESVTPVATDTVDLPPSYRFEPEHITVAAGTTVRWTNSDNFTHSVRLLDDGNVILTMAPGESVTFAFDEPGTHRYDCSFHAQDMSGTVTVTDG